MLNWTQDDLAKRAGVSDLTVRKFESGRTTPQRATLTIMRQTFEAAGVTFIDQNGGGAGVRL